MKRGKRERIKYKVEEKVDFFFNAKRRMRTPRRREKKKEETPSKIN